MSNSNLVQLIKQIAMDAVNTAKMCDYQTGVVTSIKPLKIKITNSLEIGSEFLVVPQSMTDYEMEISIDKKYGWKTQDKAGGSGESAFASHMHEIALEKVKVKVHNALKKGDRVLMLRKSGGQQFVIIDKVVDE